MADVKWQDSLPDDLKQEPMFKDIPDVGTLAKVARDLKAFQGTAIRVPGADAPPEARAALRDDLKKKFPFLVDVDDQDAVRRAAGVPDDEKGYTAEGLVLPEGVKVDEAAMAKAAKALGLSKTGYKAFVEMSAAEQGAALETRKADEKGLRTEWGAAFEEKTAQARAAALRMGVPAEAVASMPSWQLKAWANVAKGVGGEGRSAGDHGGGGGSGTPTPAEAQLQIAEIRNRDDYWNGPPAVKAALNRKVQELTILVTGV